MLDHLLAEINARFSKHQNAALRGMFLIPSVITSKPLEIAVEQITELAEIYEADLPLPSSLKSELGTFYWCVLPK